MKHSNNTLQYYFDLFTSLNREITGLEKALEELGDVIGVSLAERILKETLLAKKRELLTLTTIRVIEATVPVPVPVPLPFD